VQSVPRLDKDRRKGGVRSGVRTSHQMAPEGQTRRSCRHRSVASPIQPPGDPQCAGHVRWDRLPGRPSWLGAWCCYHRHRFGMHFHFVGLRALSVRSRARPHWSRALRREVTLSCRGRLLLGRGTLQQSAAPLSNSSRRRAALSSAKISPRPGTPVAMQALGHGQLTLPRFVWSNETPAAGGADCLTRGSLCPLKLQPITRVEPVLRWRPTRG
jgi:hypothetical protein